MILLLASLLPGAVGCGGPDPAPVSVSDSTYVQVMARLALLDTLISRETAKELDTPLDSARSRILERWGVTPDEMVAFAERRGGEPDRMSGIWQRIREVADSLRAAGWNPSAPDAPAASPADTGPGPGAAGRGATPAEVGEARRSR